MKTDPISAANAYRQALQGVMKAQTLHEARQHASKALTIVFNPPTEIHVSIASGYGHNTRQPFVTISMDNPIIQLTVEEARRQAMYILETADAAESDGFVIDWLSTGVAALNEGQAAALLADFRAYRENRRKNGE